MAVQPAEPPPSETPEAESGAARVASKPAAPDANELDWASAEPVAHDAPWRLLHLMYLVAGVAVLLWLAIAIGPVIILFAFVALVAGAVGGSFIVARRRATRQDALLWIMAIAADHGMPLPPAVLAFADQCRGRARGRIAELARQLDAGTPLPEALESQRKLASRDAVLLAWVGEGTGRLPQALRIAATARSARLPIWTAIASRLAYLLLMLFALQTIMGFILYFILPKFEAIFKDFGITLPEVTVMIISASHFLIRYGWFFGWMPLIELVVLIFLPFSFIGWGSYDIPLFDRTLGRRHTALLFRSLSLVVHAGKPIEFGLSLLANHYPTGWVRRRLVAVRNDVRQGFDWVDSLWRYQLIRESDAEVLRSAPAVGNLGWALDELAEAAERKLAIKFQVVIQTLFPLVVIFLGSIVFVTALGYFAPLVKIISELSDR
jgi:protein transport protein HofC